jgi:hypothetical protein
MMFYPFTFSKARKTCFSAILLALLFAWSQPLFAQISSANYTYAPSSGTFTPLAGGTAVPTLLVDDAASGFLPIGFTFTYMGVGYTQVRAGSDGYLSFGATGTSVTNNLATGTTVSRPVIAPFWDNMDGRATGAAASYLTTGTAGSRIFTFEWLNWQRTSGTNPALSFQVKLYEATGAIQFVYRQEAAALQGTVSASIGMTATATGSGNFVSLNNATNTATASTTTETTTINAKPATGQTYTFTPAATTVVAPSDLTFTPYATQMQVNWTASSPITNVRAYNVYNSLDNTTFNLVSTVNVGTNTAQITGLTFNTNYFWRVTAATEGGESAPATGTQATLSTPISYTWNPTTGTNDFQVATNWTPNRTVIDNTDVLLFANGGTVVANNVPTQTINQLKVSGNTNITLTPATTNTLTINGDATIDADISVANGATLQLPANITLTTNAVGNEQVLIDGTVTVALNATLTLSNLGTGIATVTGAINNGGTVTSIVASAVSFETGSVYNHTRNGGSLPTATWKTGSATNITGMTNTALTGGFGQTFYDFTWNCTGQTVSFNLSGATMNVTNNFNLTSTNGQEFRFGTSSTATVTVRNAMITASSLLVLSSGTGTSVLRVSGTFNAASTIRNTGSGSGSIEFTGTTAQTPSFVGVEGTNPVSLRINNPAGVTLSSTPVFVINNTATMEMVQGTFTGSISYGTTSGTLRYTGTTAQTIGNELPTTLPPATLIINNTVGVTMPFSRSVGGLTLTAGILTVTPNILTITGTTGASVSAGSTTSFVRGNLVRTFGTASTTYTFPVGKATFNPLTINSVTTSSTATVTGSIEVFDVNSGGTPDMVNIGGLQNRYWSVTLGGTVANFTSTSQVVLQETSLIENIFRIARSNTQTGTYSSVSAVGTGSSTITSTTGISNANSTYFFALGLDNNSSATAQTGNWSDPATWVGGVVPNAAGRTTLIRTGHTVTLDGNYTAGNTTIQTGGSLLANANTLNIQPTTGNNASLTVNGGLTIGGGTINVLGNVLISGSTAATSFTQTAGLLSIDGNSGTAGTSVASGTHLFNITNCTNIVGSGGTIRIIDPPHSSYATSSTRAVSISLSAAPTSYFFTGTHTFEFGDGTSTEIGNADGFVIHTSGSTTVNIAGLNNVTVNAGNPAGRWVGATYSAGTTTVLGTLTINANSEFRHILSTATLNLAGNLVNNGTFTCDKVVTFAGISPTGGTAAAANAQTVSGSGVFRNAVASTAKFSNITFNNTSIGGITFNIGNFDASGTITFTAGKVNLSSNTFTLGFSPAAGERGTLTYTSGGFANGTLRRWVGSTTELPASAPATPNFPLVALSNGADRSVFLFRAATGTLTGGTISVSHTDATGFNTRGTTVETCDRSSNGTWNFNNANSFNLTSTTFSANIRGYQMVSINDATALRLLESTGSTVRGTHAASSGTTTAPIISRTGLALADITNITYSLNTQAANTSNTIVSAMTGNWTTGATWVGGVVPTNADDVQILASHNVTVDANGAAAALTIQAGGTLTHTNNSVILDIAKTGRNDSYLINKGTLVVGGNAATTLNVNGYVLIENGANFTQTNGTINVDGNSGTASTSVPNTADIFSWGIGTATATRYNTGTTTLTGGQITIIDPHAITTAPTATGTGHSFVYRSDNSLNANPAHTLQFGDGTSTQVGGNTSGFTYSTQTGSGKFAAGNLIANGTTSAANRIVTGLGTTNFGILGNLTTTANSTFATTLQTSVGGNLFNAGTLTVTGISLSMQNFLSGAATPSSVAQSITNTGTFNLGANTLVINNTNLAGVTLNNNLSVGALTLTNGIVYTGANTLTVTNTSNASVAGGATNRYVNGKLAWAVTTGSTYNFPIGKGTYNPMSIAVTASGLVTLTTEVFDANAGGTADGTVIGTLATNRYWQLGVSNPANLTSYQVILNENLTATANRINVASTINGVYTNANATPTGAGSSITSNAGLVATANNFFVISSINPTITNFTPTSGGVDTEVTITGTNFTGATAVMIGGVAARSFTVVNATTITAVVGNNFTTGLVQVTSGSTATSAALATPNFTRTSCANTITGLVATATADATNNYAGFDVSWNLGAGTYSAISVYYKPQSYAYYAKFTFVGTATNCRIWQSDANNVPYDIYVQGVCNNANSERVATVATTMVAGSNNLCPMPTLPTTPLTVSGTSITFTWNASTNANRYHARYQICDASGNFVAAGNSAVVTGTSWTVNQLAPNTYYRFAVRSYCVPNNMNIATPWTAFTPSTVIQTGTGVTCVAPAPTAATTNISGAYGSGTFTWTAVAAATGSPKYIIYYRNTINDHIFSVYTDNTTYTIGGLGNGTYEYKVGVLCSGGTLLISTPQTFTITGAGNTCEVATLNPAIVNSNPATVNVSWSGTAGVQTGRLFMLQYYSLTDPNMIYSIYTELPSYTLVVNAHLGLVFSTNYAWRVWTLCNGTMIGMSNTLTFTTAASTTSKNDDLASNLSVGNSLEIFPNPAKEQVNIAYSSNGIANLQIFDMLGREVYALQEFNQFATIVTNRFASGTYLVKITEKDKVITKKFVVE